MSSNHDNRHAARLTIAVTREMVVPGPVQEIFDFVAAEDVLPKILTGYGMVPGVASTSDVSGPWDRPGSRRIVHLADGSTLNEGLTQYDRPSHFAYRVGDPSFALKYLMTEARGEFWLEAADGGTTVRWTYTFRAKNRLTKLPLMLFAKSQWGGYMDVCMANIVARFAGAPAASSGYAARRAGPLPV